MSTDLTELLKYLKQNEKRHGIHSPVFTPEEMTLLISVVTLAEADMRRYIKTQTEGVNKKNVKRVPPGCIC